MVVPYFITDVATEETATGDERQKRTEEKETECKEGQNEGEEEGKEECKKQIGAENEDLRAVRESERRFDTERDTNTGMRGVVNLATLLVLKTFFDVCMPDTGDKKENGDHRLEENEKLSHIISKIENYASDKGLGFPKSLKEILYSQNYMPTHSSTQYVYPVVGLNEYYREIGDNPDLPLDQRMKYDLVRCSSFSSYPNSNVSALSLSRAGFYYEGRGDEVKCFRCGLKWRNWQESDNPAEVHLRESPRCDFIKQFRRTAENEQVATNTPEQSTYRQQDNECYDNEGITYSREDNTAGGTAENGTRRYTECISTQRNCSRTGGDSASSSLGTSSVTNSREQNTNNTVTGEANKVPSCQTRQPEISTLTPASVSNSPIQSSSSASTTLTWSRDNGASQQVVHSDTTSSRRQCNDVRPNSRGGHYTRSGQQGDDARSSSVSGQSSSCSGQEHGVRQNSVIAQPKTAAETLEPLGISIEKPKYPQYAVLAIRMSSFRNWPKNKSQSVETLAKAGFVYEGEEDYTRCFFCAGGLRDWEQQDDPWIEHARWYPKCTFLRQCKGDDFVKRALEGKLTSSEETQGINHTENASVVRREAVLDSAAARSVLEMGYSKDIVLKAIDRKSKGSDSGCVTAESLLQEVWELEEAGEGNETSHRDHTGDQAATLGASKGASCSKEDDGTEDDIETLIAENRKLKDQQMCRICMDEEISVVFLPCGHMATCVNCAPAMRKCPMCRAFIKGTVKAILS